MNMTRSDNNEFRSIVKKGIIGTIAVATLIIGGCNTVKIDDGFVGFQRSATGQIESQLVHPGIHVKVLGSIKEIRASAFNIDLKDLKPKDKNGVMFDDMDLTVSVRLNTQNEEAITKYVREFSDLTPLDGHYYIGLENVKREAASSIPDAIRKYETVYMLDNKSEVEKAAAAQTQKDLDEKYPGVFQVVGVNAYSITVNKSLEKQAQDSVALDAQKKTMDIQLEQMQQKEELFRSDLKVIQKAAKDLGVPLEMAMHLKTLQSLEGMASKGNNVTVIYGNGGMVVK